MKSIKILAAITLFLPLHFSFAEGLTVGNGGGFAESNLHFAFRSLPEVLKRAAQHPAFKDPSLVPMITALLPVAKTEARQTDTLKIVKTHPITNQSWGAEIFYGSSQTQTPIYVSLDALYPKDQAGTVRPFTYAQSLSLVVRLGGLRLPNFKDSEWTVLGQKIAKFAQLKSEVLYSGFVGMVDYDYPSVTTLHDPQSHASWGVLFTDFEQVTDVGSSIETFLRKKFPTLESFHFSNLNWLPSSTPDERFVQGSLAVKLAGQSWDNTAYSLKIRVIRKFSASNPREYVLDVARLEYLLN